MSWDPMEGYLSLNGITSIFSFHVKVFVFLAFGAIIECHEDKNDEASWETMRLHRCSFKSEIERMFL